VKVLIDTSVWVEFFKKNEKYFEPVKKLMENQDALAIECIFGELLQGAKNNREIDIITSYWNNLPKIIKENLFIEAGKLSSNQRLAAKGIGLIDCAIIVSAREKNAKIWSLDKKLNSMLRKEEILEVSF